MTNIVWVINYVVVVKKKFVVLNIVAVDFNGD